MASVPSVEVQLLLAAEKKAIEIVTEARKRKNQKLKRAKEEAASEAEEYRAERQAKFDKHELQVGEYKEDKSKQIEQDTIDKLENMNDRFNKTGYKVTEKLIQEVVNSVIPRLHPNQKPSWLTT